jgi:WD40 repeat protein
MILRVIRIIIFASFIVFLPTPNIGIIAQYENYQKPRWHPHEDIIALTNALTIRLYTTDFSEILDEFHLVEESSDVDDIRSGDIAWSPDGAMIAVSITGVGVPPVLQVWDRNTRQKILEIFGVTVETPFLWNDTSDRIALAFTTGPGSSTVRIYEVPSGLLLQEFETDSPANIKRIAWFPPNNQIALYQSGQQAGTYILNTETGSFNQLPVMLDSFVQYTYSPDGRYLAGTPDSDENTVYVFDIETFQIIHELKDHTDWVLHVVWFENRIVTVSLDGTMRFWNVVSGNQINVLQTGVISRPDFSPSGNEFVSQQYATTVYVRNSTTGAILFSLDPEYAPTPTPQPTATLDPTPNIKIQSRLMGESSDRATFRYDLINEGDVAVSSIRLRVYFVPDLFYGANEYTLNLSNDSTGFAIVRGPFSSGLSSDPFFGMSPSHYFEVDYGSLELQPGDSWQADVSLILSTSEVGFNAANDWWYTDITTTVSETSYLPVYVNSSLETGQTP